MLYPITNETRTTLDLNGVWSFKLEHDQENIDVSQPLQTDKVMAVPGSFNDQGVTKEIRNHVGNVWYERQFTIPKVLEGQRCVLRFGSATHKATVYIDGKEVTTHTGGFLPFEVELEAQDAIGEHRLTVCVNNILDETTLPVGKYYEEEGPNNTRIKKMIPTLISLTMQVYIDL